MSRFRTDKDRLRGAEKQIAEILAAPSTPAEWLVLNVPYTAFSVANTQAFVKIASLPPGCIVMDQVLILVEPFVAAGAVVKTMKTAYLLAPWTSVPDVLEITDTGVSPSITTVKSSAGAISFADPSAGADIWLDCDMNPANCDTLTAGQVKVYLHLAMPEQPDYDFSIVNVVGATAATTSIP